MADLLISICIPTYERPEYLKRLLDSIKIQTVRIFEVIITDDSKTAVVESFIKNYQADFPLHYHKNIPSLGTAKNMVEGLKYATSSWIKLIHDDDFFASENALEEHANAISNNVRFVFSGYNIYLENTGKHINKTISQRKFNHTSKFPALLFANNIIGPPSVLMIHKDVKDVFDISLKWFTDVEYYYRILLKEKAVYIAHPLVNISYNDTQITSYTRTDPKVVIPESLYIINKYKKDVVSNIALYDAWWRILRNMGICNIDHLREYAPNKVIPMFIKKMIFHQRLVPLRLLKIGYISKISMLVSYFANKNNLNKRDDYI